MLLQRLFGAISVAIVINMPFAAAMGIEHLEDVPTCFRTCGISRLQAANCSTTDVTAASECVCRNSTLLSSISSCLDSTCGNLTQQFGVSMVERAICSNFPKESRSPDIIITAVVAVILSVPVVLIRCVSRLQTDGALGADDYTALVATVLLTAFATIELAGGRLGLGMHGFDVGVEASTTLVQLLYASEIIYVLVQALAKISILLLMIRLFPSRRFHILAKLFIALMVGHAIGFVGAVVFQCLPIVAIWDKGLGRNCLDKTALGFANTGISVGEDVALILLQIPELLLLQTSRFSRVSVAVIYVMATFSLAASLIRFKFFASAEKSVDPTWDNVDLAIWSTVELITIVILGSLAALRPWIAKVVSLNGDTPTRSRDSDMSYMVKYGAARKTIIVAQPSFENRPATFDGSDYAYWDRPYLDKKRARISQEESYWG